MIYSYAKLSKYDFGFIRFMGTGLGNLLFPWARAVVASKKYGFKIIEPTWLQIKIGPILRGEFDFRLYGKLFLSSKVSIGGLKKIFFLAVKKKFNESVIWENPDCIKRFNDCIFIFKGLGDYFKEISEEHELVRSELLKIANPIYATGLKYDFSNCVCLHIRRGDFKIEGWETPTKWFLWVMTELKEKINPDLKFKIFSDGSDEELSPILTQKNTERLFFGSALADLIAMSNSRILVGSYNSSFSMWASYLGHMPTIWPGSSSFQPNHYENQNFIEISCGQEISEAFLKSCKKNIFYQN